MALITPEKTFNYEPLPVAKTADILRGDSKFEVVFDPERSDYTTHVVHPGGRNLHTATHDIVIVGLSPDKGIDYIHRLVSVALTGVDQRNIDAVQRAILHALDVDPSLKFVREEIQR